MVLSPLGGLGPSTLTAASPVASSAGRFSALMKARAPLENAAVPVRAEPGVRAAVTTPSGGASPCRSTELRAPASATAVLERVTRAQQRMEDLLRVAETGRSFSPAELLSLQTHVYRASQELDLAGKVVEKATGGVKQVLQTQV